MYETYIIQKGDNFNSVAKMFNTSVDTLKSINNLYFDDSLRNGMEIVVPKSNNEYFSYYIVDKGDTLYKIAREYNINPKLLASLNGLNMEDYIYPNQEIMIPKNGYSYYITSDGDTINSVSSLFNETKEKLIMENPTIYLLKDQILVCKRN